MLRKYECERYVRDASDQKTVARPASIPECPVWLQPKGRIVKRLPMWRHLDMIIFAIRLVYLV